MNCIFQCWAGPMRSGVEASVAAVRSYADRIGAVYMFSTGCQWAIDAGMQHHAKCFEKTRVVYEPFFESFDQVAFLDCDVFPVEGLADSIFEESIGDWSMAEEPHQPDYRQARKRPINGVHDEAWAQKVARHWNLRVRRDGRGRVRTFNSGVIVWSRPGRIKARRNFIHPGAYYHAMKPGEREYLPGFYWNNDQQWFNAMAAHPALDFTELPVEWNRTVHMKDDGSIYDGRSPNTRFVHVQMRGADDWSAQQLEAFVNNGQSRNQG